MPQLTVDDVIRVWRKILQHKEIPLDKLETEINSEDQELSKKLRDVLAVLYALFLIDYEGDKIVLARILDDEILEMPCIRCDKAKICRVGAKNNPFRCEEFVKWFIKHMTE